MKKNLLKMAFVCLAMMCMSSAQSPTVEEPTVRVAFQYNEVIAYPGHPFDLMIFFRNTSRLYVYRDDNFTMEEITLQGNDKNNPDERMITHNVVINEPDFTVRFTIIAVFDDGDDYVDVREVSTHVSYHTYPNPEL